MTDQEILEIQQKEHSRKQLTQNFKQQNQSIYDTFLQQAHNKPFWLWGQKHHETWRYCPQCGEKYSENPKDEIIQPLGHHFLTNEYATFCKYCTDENGHPVKLLWNDQLKLDKGECCFNHLIGLPVKVRRNYETKQRYPDVMPIFDWQKYILDSFNSIDDWTYIKATGLGMTELKLRHSGWKASTDYNMSKSQIPIVVGQREELALLLIERFKDLFPFYIDTDKKTAIINDCWFHTFPSNNIGGIRSLKNPTETIVDELDFFPQVDKRNILPTLFRYIAKSGQVLRCISTPSEPNGICFQLEKEPGRFKIMKLHYKVGLHSIFTPREIQEQQLAPGFLQEYCLEYLGGIGNFFDAKSVDACTFEDYDPTIPVKEAITIMGVDTGYTTGSQFAIVIYSWFKYKLHCMYAYQEDSPKGNEMVKLIQSLRHLYYVDKILIDGSDPDFIYDLKDALKEYPINYHKVDEERYRWMIAEPVSFTGLEYEFLVHDRSMINNSGVKFHTSQMNVTSGFKSAYVEIDQYKKDKSANADLVDASSMVMSRFKPRTVNVVDYTPEVRRLAKGHR